MVENISKIFIEKFGEQTCISEIANFFDELDVNELHQMIDDSETFNEFKILLKNNIIKKYSCTYVDKSNEDQQIVNYFSFFTNNVLKDIDEYYMLTEPLLKYKGDIKILMVVCINYINCNIDVSKELLFKLVELITFENIGELYN